MFQDEKVHEKEEHEDGKSQEKNRIMNKKTKRMHLEMTTNKMKVLPMKMENLKLWMAVMMTRKVHSAR
jgi:hypothetical protein